MVLKDLAVLYGRVALIMIVFAFVAGIVAAPLLSNADMGPSLAAAQDHAPSPQLIRVKSTSPSGGRG